MPDYRARGGVIAGDLRQRIRYQVKAEGVPSPYGDAAEQWADAGFLWAEVVSLTGEELLEAHEIHAEVSIRVTVRYNPLVNTIGRFIYNGRIIHPLSVNGDPLNRVMVCMCREHIGEA